MGHLQPHRASTEVSGKDIARLKEAVAKAWSLDTAKQWTSEIPAAGQCNVTAVVVQELVGGDILKTPIASGYHFYNRIDGRRHDLTAVQFERAIEYDDIQSDREEALQGVTQPEVRSMRASVLRHLDTQH